MNPRLEDLERHFITRYMQFHPGHAATVGIHDHDLKLEDLSAQAIQAFCADLDELRSMAAGLGSLEPEDAIEQDVLLSMIDGTLFEYRRVRAWQQDPYSYAEVLSSQLNTILIFDYAPLAGRLKAIIAKETQVPRFVETAKRNLLPTAPILVNYGIRGVTGALSLVRKDLPAAFSSVREPELRHRFEESTRVAVKALESFVDWLKSEYPAGETRGYALGLATYSGWLAARERITSKPRGSKAGRF